MKHACLLIAMLLFVVKSTTGISLFCEFTFRQSKWGMKYTCEAKHLITFLSERVITGIEGTHLEGKSNDDVEAVFAEHQSCQYMPINLGSHFKNLIILKIMKSNILHLTKDDLAGLDKLEQLDLSYNPITRLHNDFFKGHSSVEHFSFYDCSINFIEKGALDHLTNLKEAHFQHNECIDYRGEYERLLPAMLKQIELNCEGPREVNFVKKTHKKPLKPNISDMSEFYINEKTEPIDNSFIRRNVFSIMSFLLLIIFAMVAFLYKINAFSRQSFY